jgi:acetyl-CoA carboxylase biotin carboxylase subunit
VDSGVYSGATVPVHYDPMIAKLTVWGEDRDHAIGRMRRALSEYVVGGITTNIAFHEEVLTAPEFLDGSYDTEFIPNLMRGRETPAPELGFPAEIAAVIAAHRRDEALIAGGAAKGAAGTQQQGSRSRWKTLARLEQRREW